MREYEIRLDAELGGTAPSMSRGVQGALLKMTFYKKGEPIALTEVPTAVMLRLISPHGATVDVCETQGDEAHAEIPRSFLEYEGTIDATAAIKRANEKLTAIDFQITVKEEKACTRAT